MNRRGLIAGALSLAATGARAAAPFFDGQSVTIGGREHFLSDIVAPSPDVPRAMREYAVDYAAAVFNAAIQRGAPIHSETAPVDRWERLTGPVRWRMPGGRETTLQEILLSQGAARVAPQSDDLDFIDRLYRAEDVARENTLGLWTQSAFRIRDAERGEWSRGFQIYRGVIRAANERNSRIFFNFGADFRTDFTATLSKGALRRWRRKIDYAAAEGRHAEVRGVVERINGPSIELKHEMQLRLIEA